MIIRKPYAFFIKYFKVFHILFFVLSFILIVNTISLYEFFHGYISKTATIVSTFEISSVLVNYFWTILLLIGLFVVMIVLIYKKKSIKFYIIQIFIYSLVLILFIVCNNYLNNLTKYLVDIRVVKAIHDILFMFCIVEAISMMLLFARATGFDIKSFDFDKEYTKLVAEDVDREEVEVAFDFDVNTIKTKLNKFLRGLKYFYLENKLVSLIIIGISIIFLGISFFLYTKSKPYINVKGNRINHAYYNLEYKGFYLDDSNISNVVIDEDSLFVVLDLNISTTSNKRFNMSNLMLYIDNNVYTPSSSYNQYFTDFGTGYSSQEINGNNRYYFVYKIPSTSKFENVQIVYNSGNNYYLKKVELTDLRSDNDRGSYSVGETININYDFINSLNFVINEASFSEKFLVPYIFKAGNVNYNSAYYVSPSISGNYDKSVIRVVSSDCDLINNYGDIYYGETDKIVKANVSLKQISPLKKSYGYCYYETDKDVKDADTVLLKINVRGNIYNYYLK